MLSAALEPWASAPACQWWPTPPGLASAVLHLDAIAREVPPGAPLCSPLAQFLSDPEQQHYARLPVRKRQIEWLAGRLAARHALKRLLGMPHWPRHCSVSYTPEGRPMFELAQLSISHSRTEALAVVAHGPVGIDTETFDAVRAESLSMLLAPEEVRCVQRGWGCDAPTARTLLWCLKEALFKAAGHGAFVPFAMALRVQAWRPAAAQPVWRWQGALASHQPLPVLAHWRVDAALDAHAARVLVSPLAQPVGTAAATPIPISISIPTLTPNNCTLLPPSA